MGISTLKSKISTILAAMISSKSNIGSFTQLHSASTGEGVNFAALQEEGAESSVIECYRGGSGKG